MEALEDCRLLMVALVEEEVHIPGTVAVVAEVDTLAVVEVDIIIAINLAVVVGLITEEQINRIHLVFKQEMDK